MLLKWVFGASADASGSAAAGLGVLVSAQRQLWLPLDALEAGAWCVRGRVQVGETPDWVYLFQLNDTSGFRLTQQKWALARPRACPYGGTPDWVHSLQLSDNFRCGRCRESCR